MITLNFNFFNSPLKLKQIWTIQQVAEFFALIGRHNKNMTSFEDNYFLFEEQDQNDILTYIKFINENF